MHRGGRPSANRVDGRCVGAALRRWAADGGESDVDCGGPDCLACDDGSACREDADCSGGLCVDQECASPPRNPILEDSAVYFDDQTLGFGILVQGEDRDDNVTQFELELLDAAGTNVLGNAGPITLDFQRVASEAGAFTASIRVPTMHCLNPRDSRSSRCLSSVRLESRYLMPMGCEATRSSSLREHLRSLALRRPVTRMVV